MLRDERGEASLGFMLVAGLLVFGLVIAGLSYHQVPEGHEGVGTEWGAVTGEQYESGANWRIPFMQGIQNVETRPRTYTMADSQGEGEKAQKQDAIVVQTVNGSTVRVDVTIRYRIKSDEADEFVREWNDVEQAEERLMRPTVRSEMRDEAASIPTSVIYTSRGREALAAAGQQALASETQDEPIIIEAVQVRAVNLPSEIDRALDEKEVAKQRVQVEQEKIKQEEAKAEQKRVQAQAEADVVEIEGEALRQNPIVLDQQAIEAMDEGTVYVVPEGGDSPPVILQQSERGNSSSSTTNSPGMASP